MVSVCGLLLAGLLFGGCVGSEKNPSVTEGMAAVEALDYETALECFARAAESGEDLRLIYRGQGLAYMGLTRYEEAVKVLEQALVSDDGRPDSMDYDINFYLATAYYRAGDIQNCIKTYDAILAMRPKDRVAGFLRGSVLIESDFAKAKADFERIIELAPDDYDQLLDIYTVLESYGYKEAGVVYLQSAIDRSSKELTDYQKGRIYYHMQDYEKARNYLEKARDTKNWEAVLLLGQTYEALGDYNYAISVYSDCIEKEQADPRIYNRLGMCRLEMQAYREALAAFQAGIAIEENDMMQALKFNEIITYERLGEFRKAASLMESYLAMYPDDTQAQREQIFLQTR